MAGEMSWHHWRGELHQWLVTGRRKATKKVVIGRRIYLNGGSLGDENAPEVVVDVRKNLPSVIRRKITSVVGHWKEKGPRSGGKWQEKNAWMFLGGRNTPVVGHWEEKGPQK